jgi:hypothetical protein
MVNDASPDSPGDAAGERGGADASGGDGASDAAGVDESGGEAGDGEGSVDAAQEAGCTPSCSQFSACEQSMCLDFERYGYVNAGPDTQFVAGGELAGIQIPLTVCGLITGIGFVNTLTPINEPFRFGIYTDSGGQPDRLLAQTALTTLQNGTNEVPVEQPALLACSDATTYYWLIGVWRLGVAIDFEAEHNPGEPWIHAEVAADAYLNSGLPGPFPAPGAPFDTPLKQPHIYAIVARTK